ncbi:MAG TPA: anion transporter [Candidatus Binataceae bacterium]|nr:anion transporter [Candidatus Binataceae bacterium]
MNAATALPLAIFAITYAGLAVGKLPMVRVDRCGVALIGAVAMVVSGALSQNAALNAVDFHTLALLLGMMIIVANLRLSGVFTWLAERVFGRAHTGFGLLATTVALSGVLAAFFVNDVICLVLAPVVIDAAAQAALPAVPLLLGLATASNIGSAATVTGNPQNMIVAGFAHLEYMAFLIRLAPGAIVGLVIDYAIIAWIYRRTLRGKRRVASTPQSEPGISLDKPAAFKAAMVTGGTLVCFAMGFPTGVVALSAAAVMLLVQNVRPDLVYAQVDWTMLLMFAGLFVVVGGAARTGFQMDIIKVVDVERLTHPAVLAATVAVLSNLVSNVPAVLLFRPLFPLLGSSQRVALLLAAVSTYAGNLTLLGSIANLIVVENARRRGVEVDFREHLLVGIPITVLTIIVAVAMLR